MEFVTTLVSMYYLPMQNINDKYELSVLQIVKASRVVTQQQISNVNKKEVAVVIYKSALLIQS